MGLGFVFFLLHFEVIFFLSLCWQYQHTQNESCPGNSPKVSRALFPTMHSAPPGRPQILTGPKLGCTQGLERCCYLLLLVLLQLPAFDCCGFFFSFVCFFSWLLQISINLLFLAGLSLPVETVQFTNRARSVFECTPMIWVAALCPFLSVPAVSWPHQKQR